MSYLTHFATDRKRFRSTLCLDKQGEADEEQRTLPFIHHRYLSTAGRLLCREFFCHYKTYTCRFLLSGHLHGDKPVDGRFWSKYHRPEYQCHSMDELEPGIYLPGQWSGLHARLERHLYPIGAERHRGERDLEW